MLSARLSRDIGLPLATFGRLLSLPQGEEAVRQIVVPIEHVGRVIGKSGSTIRLLQETTGARVVLPRVCWGGGRA